MKNIRQEVAQSMTDFVASDGILTSHFLFSEDFIGFQGHFPANKVLPGVCQIQCIISMLEKWQNKIASLKKVALAKFFSPVFPLEEVICICRDITYKDGYLIVKAFISRGDNKVAEFKLKISFIERDGK